MFGTQISYKSSCLIRQSPRIRTFSVPGNLGADGSSSSEEGNKFIVRSCGNQMALTLLVVVCVVGVSRFTLLCEAAPSNREDSDYCNSPACRDAAKILIDSMDTSADPCQDFYRYACGGWIDKHPIPEEKGWYSTFDVLIDDLSNDLGGILQNATNENHVKPIIDSAKLYQGCIDKDAREAQGLEPLKSLLNTLGGWPMANPEWSDAGYQWHKQVATVRRLLGVRAIFGIRVEPDANHTTHHIINIDQPYEFGLGRNQLVNLNASDRNDEIVTAYKNYMIATGKLLNPNANVHDLGNDAEQMIQFESRLAQFSKPPEERRDARAMYHKMTIAEMQRVTENTHYAWRDFFNDVLAEFPHVTDDTEVVVSEKEYVKNSAKLASETDPRIVANYIGWIALKKIGHHTTKQFRDNEFEYQKVELGVQKPEKIERICAHDTVEIMGFAVGRLYVDKFFSEEDKHDADELVENMRSAYEATLRNNTWLDEVTKNKAIDKLEAMINKMGYPTWIKNDNELIEHYSSVDDIKQDEYFTSFLKARKAYEAMNLIKWNQPTDRTNDWITEPPVVNAFYSPDSNSITFPAGILRPPFYRNGRSLPLNYGGIGTVIGHEMSHGFDDEGSQFDPEGNLVNWWSQETRNKFNEKANCFRNQYSSYVEPTTNMHLNGNTTVGENIADNGALRNAFIAYKRQMLHSSSRNEMRNKRLPGVSATPEQLFFLGYSSMWCGNLRKEALEYQIQYDSHAPNEFRVTIPLSNSKEFAQAFGCPLGSTMNPESKCLLW